MNPRVLVLDDDESMCTMLAAALAKHGFEVQWRTAALEGLEVLESSDIDVVVADINLGGMTGLELCERIAANRPDIPVVVITAFGNLETAIAAIRVGAYDFIPKPFAVEALALTLERAVRLRALREEVKRLQRVVEQSRPFGDLLGTSPAMQSVGRLLDRIVESEASVLITGETGTGAASSTSNLDVPKNATAGSRMGSARLALRNSERDFVNSLSMRLAMGLRRARVPCLPTGSADSRPPEMTHQG